MEISDIRQVHFHSRFACYNGVVWDKKNDGAVVLNLTTMADTSQPGKHKLCNWSGATMSYFCIQLPPAHQNVRIVNASTPLVEHHERILPTNKKSSGSNIHRFC